MRIVVSIFSLSFLAFFSCSNERIVIENDLAVLRLKGQIKRVEKTIYKAVEKFGEIQKDGFADNLYEVNSNDRYSILYFDKYGYTIRRDYFSAKDNSSSGYGLIAYDSYHREISYISYNDKGQIKSSSTKTYNDKEFTCKTVSNGEFPWTSVEVL